MSEDLINIVGRWTNVLLILMREVAYEMYFILLLSISPHDNHDIVRNFIEIKLN